MLTERDSRGWAVVDVETSGLYPSSCRVLSVAAFPLDQAGRPAGAPLSTLINAGCDPGPVHIHGLTLQRLAGAPRFAEVLPALVDVLDKRVLVAHNASFDYRFLAAEARRAGAQLPVRHRLCTLALSRRLGVDVPNHRLGTLARYWGVEHRQAHDAHDDALALSGVFARSLGLADQLGMPLPLVACTGHTGPGPFPSRVVKRPCPWRHPGVLRAGEPLVQGMKIVITGETRLPREELVERLTHAGLEVLDSVSRLTNVLVCNSADLATRKAMRARAEGTLVLSEAMVLQMARAVRAGTPRTAATSNARSAPAPQQRGPLSGRRVLVIGGTHAHAAEVRAAILSRGGAAAVNLSASVTDVVLLVGGENDSRLDRAVAAGVALHRGSTALGIPLPVGAATVHAIAPAPAQPVRAWDLGRTEEPTAPARVLTRGAVIDLPAGSIWTVNVAWRADAMATGAELDVVAFLVDDVERVVVDEDFVFYNAPVSQDGAVALSVDGDSEQSIRIDLDLLPEYCGRVVVAAALHGDGTFGDLGAVTLSVDGPDSTAATSTLDAATSERTMLLAEVYRRVDRWRVRAVGQGYDDGLAELASRYGVDIA